MASLDVSDPVVLSTVAQTIVLTLTLVIFILSFRSQNKSLREAAYQKIMDDYTDAVRMLIERPELSKLRPELASANRALSGELRSRD